MSLALAAKTIEGGERLALTPNLEPKKAANLHRKRWQIECLFAEAKTRGLDLEDARLTIPQRLLILLVIRALACVCIRLAARWVMGRSGIRQGKMDIAESSLPHRFSLPQGSFHQSGLIPIPPQRYGFSRKMNKCRAVGENHLVESR